MKKFLKLTCAIALTFTMISSMNASLYAAETGTTITWIQEQYIWVNESAESNDYYLSSSNYAIGDPGVAVVDANGDGVDDVTGLALDQMYSSVAFEDPYEADPSHILYTGNLLATYELASTSLPTEMTFNVYNQSGMTEEVTIDTSAGTLQIGYDYQIANNSGEGIYYNTTLYVWDGAVAYEVVDSSFTYNGDSSTWVVPYSANGSDYVATYDKLAGVSEITNVVIEDVTPTPAPTPEPDPEPTPEPNDDTKVVNGPANANAAMIAITSGSAALFTLATISRRRK